MKKFICSIVAIALMVPALPINSIATANEINQQQIEEEGFVVLESTDNTSIYQYEEEGELFEVVEESVEDDNGKSTIYTKIYNITENRVLSDEYTSTVDVNNEGDVVLNQDGEITIIDQQDNEENEQEPMFGIMAATKRGGSLITGINWSEPGNKIAYAYIYPNKQKRTTTTSQKYKDFKRAANDVRQEELEFVGLGIIGIAEDVFRSVKNGKPMSLETIKKILKATGKKIPIAGTAYALFSYGSLIRTAVKYHGKI